MSGSPFHSVEEAIAAIKAGQLVIVADNEDRENEGDLICAAEKITPELINFMATHARGLICMPISSEIAQRLGLHLMTSCSTDSKGTAFTISIDGSPENGVSTGISAKDRATTIHLCMDEKTSPSDLRRPGHIFPLIAKEGGVLERSGQTEAAVDLARLAGLKAGGVICEIINPDGTMSRRKDLEKFSRQHQIPFITVEQILEYRLQREILVDREAEASLPTKLGDFQLYGYSERFSRKEHLALLYGDITARKESLLVRVHSECLTGDVFGSLRCDCQDQLSHAKRQIVEEGAGILLYLRQEGRGIGLMNKLKAYALQDQGLDTYQANRQLGFKDDLRQYWVAAHILKDLGVSAVRLLTNNQDKIRGLQNYGIKVENRVPLVCLNDYNKKYLESKRDKHNHLFVW